MHKTIIPVSYLLGMELRLRGCGDTLGMDSRSPGCHPYVTLRVLFNLMQGDRLRNASWQY